MGILNITPDSFSDGGHYQQVDAAVAAAERMVEQGADLLDVGAESTRPGANPVPEELEWARLEPVLRALSDVGRPISVDTRRPGVMRRALDLGVDLINDVSGFGSPDAVRAVASGQAAVCVMHMLGTDPKTMQAQPQYSDVVAEVAAHLQKRCESLLDAGVHRDRISTDPGFGFGKTLEHNLALLAELPRTAFGQCPILVGLSRKSALGQITGRAVEDRLAASVGAALTAVSYGAEIIRVHDVSATVDALKVWVAARLVAQKGSMEGKRLLLDSKSGLWPSVLVSSDPDG